MNKLWLQWQKMIQDFILLTKQCSGFCNVQKWDLDLDRTGCLRLVMISIHCVWHTRLTKLICKSGDHALWNRATTTIKRVTIERSSEDLTFSSNSFLFLASGFSPFVSRGRNTSFTSDWNFSMSSITFAFVISIIHPIMHASKSGSVFEFWGRPSFSSASISICIMQTNLAENIRWELNNTHLKREALGAS